MRCSEFEKLEMKYIDGSISPKELKRLNEHISVCTACASEHTTYAELVGCMSAIAEPLPEEGFTQKVMMSVEALPPLRKKRPGFIYVCEAVCAVSAFMGLWNLALLNGDRLANAAPGSGVMYDLAGLVKLITRLDAAIDTALYTLGKTLGIYGEEPVFAAFTAIIIILGIYMQIRDIGTSQALGIGTDNRHIL